MNSMTTPTNATIGNSQVEKNESRTIGLIDEYARGFCMRHLPIGLIDFRSAHPFSQIDWLGGLQKLLPRTPASECEPVHIGCGLISRGLFQLTDAGPKIYGDSSGAPRGVDLVSH